MQTHLECAARGRPRVEIGDIVRAHRDSLERTHTLSVAQSRALSAMALCRTAALGGHLDVCTACGHEQPSYNSCRNRHCPKCQALAQEQWISARLERTLPVRHFHVVFTLPSQLRALAAYRPRVLYNLLFETASRTLLEVARGPRLGALLGITAVLHTWTRDLRLHPHLHCIVTGGGLSLDGERWIGARSDYLLPVQVLSAVFRGKFLEALRREQARDSFAGFDAFEDPEGFERLCSAITKHAWVVYAKKAFAGPEQVFRYLGRYTHRVGIANSRLVEVDDENVTFRTKNGKTVTLTAVEFLTRLVQHVLPKGYVKIRHYGLLASSNIKTKLNRAYHLLRPSPAASPARAPSTWLELLLALTGRDVHRCPLCDGVLAITLLPRPSVSPTARAPPR